MTPITTLLWRRRGGADDDSGSILLAMLLVLIGSALASLMVPMLLIQIHSTTSDLRRVRELNAAQAGVDSAIGQIQAANDGSMVANTTYSNGAIKQLPCAVASGPVTSPPIGSSLSPSRYQVTIGYYVDDPHGQDTTWLANNRILCIDGHGTESTPSYAVITSSGTDTSSGSFDFGLTRTIRATYIFTTTNQNIAGGQIHNQAGSHPDLCMDAGSADPTPGITVVTMQNCVANSPGQQFAYKSNLTLQLVASVGSADPLGLCVDAGSPESAGLKVYFQPCASTTVPEQQWSFNTGSQFEGTSDGVNFNNLCLSGGPAAAAQVTLANCGSAGNAVWSPDASVGAGASGAPNGELVNYKQFGRCLDVSNFWLPPTLTFLIDWPCKQAPTAAGLDWNQVWTLPSIKPGQTFAVGPIYTNAPRGPECLTNEGYNQYALLADKDQGCSSSTSVSDMTWTVYGNTGNYGTSYVIKNAGLCLAPTDPSANPPDLYGGATNASKIIVTKCDGTSLQKWNAPPDLEKTEIKDISEK